MPISISPSLKSLLESLRERARVLLFPPAPPLARSFVFVFFFFEEEEEEEADWPPTLNLAAPRIEEVASVAVVVEEEEDDDDDKEEREEDEEEKEVDSEEKEKSMSVFGWGLFAGLFVCIGGAEDTFETALAWSCSLVRSCDLPQRQARCLSVQLLSRSLIPSASLAWCLRGQRKTQNVCS
jgi:hypothetical protein